MKIQIDVIVSAVVNHQQSSSGPFGIIHVGLAHSGQAVKLCLDIADTLTQAT